MCTLTWRHDRDGLRIYFNRDEKRTRLAATPPAVKIIRGVRVLAPVDGNAGGTWLAVNEYGLAVAVLNFYEAENFQPDRDARYESRGHLVLNVATADSTTSASGKLKEIQLSQYRPFYLAVFNAEGGGFLSRWNGSKIMQNDLRDLEIPITTSSFQTEDVLRCRHAMFDRMRTESGEVTNDMLRAFHHSRDLKGGAYSVTMTRPDAQTVSFSAVNIGKQSITFYYQPRLTEGSDPEYLPAGTFTLNRA